MIAHHGESSSGSLVTTIITWVSLVLAVLAILQNIYIYRRSRAWAAQSEASAAQAAESLSIIDGTAHELSASVSSVHATLGAAHAVIHDLRGDVRLLVELVDVAAAGQTAAPPEIASLAESDLGTEVRRLVSEAEAAGDLATVLDVVGGRGQVERRLKALKEEIAEGRVLLDGPLRSGTTLRAAHPG